jgi:TetR/AcrR family transcriptional regulator, cholesterol catabolism regulator
MAQGSTAVPEPARRPRGRPPKAAHALDEGNRRQELLRGAARLFRHKGFAATTTRDIAAAAGMQSGSPFYHFESKAALLFAVMEQGMRAALQSQALALQAAPAQPPQALLRVLVRTHFDVLLGPGSDFIPVMLYEWRSLTPVQRADIARLQRDYEAAWTATLDALCAAGRIRADARVARLMFLGALNWSVQWYKPRPDASLDELTDQAMLLFLPDTPRSTA